SDSSSTVSYALSLHDALPILRSNGVSFPRVGRNLPLVFVACFHFQYTPSRNRAQALKSPLLDPRVKFCARTRDPLVARQRPGGGDRKSTRLNSSHVKISYAVF